MNNTNWSGGPTIDAARQPGVLRKEALENVRQLQRKASRGLWVLALFIIVCLLALNDFAVLPDLPASVRASLGRPPSTRMISGALVIYTFSAIILILSRMMHGSGAYSGIGHVGYLAGFFGFYHFAKGLHENYLAVVVAGLTILSLETYHVWAYCQERIKEELELIARLNRMEQWNAEREQE